jgi:drug/metabolite transporter (DMT)-like permease
VGAILYLGVCGSWIGCTAYIWLLQQVPTFKVSTDTYFNPVVAVFMGWLVLHERIDRFILMRSAIMVASVVLVNSAKASTRAALVDEPSVEAATRLNLRFYL